MHGAHRRGAEMRQQQTKEQAKANEEAKRKIAPYKTDEGMCGNRAWKEYTAGLQGQT